MSSRQIFKKTRKTLLFLVNLLTIFSMTAGPVLAAVPSVTGVTVSGTSIKVQFDRGVATVNGDPEGGTTPYANDLRNYSFQHPDGTSYPLSRTSPYNNFINYIPGDNATSTVNIYGMNLTQGQGWRLVINNIDSATTTPEVTAMDEERSGTVATSTDPIINTIDPLYLSSENASTTITLAGSNFPTATSATQVFCHNGMNDVELSVISAEANEVVADTDGVELRSGLNDCYVVDTGNNTQSVRRPFFYYDPASYGVIHGTITDVDQTTPVDKVEIDASTTAKNWERFSGKSQADGKFAVVVPAGTYNVSYKTPGAGSTGAAPLKSTGWR